MITSVRSSAVDVTEPGAQDVDSIRAALFPGAGAGESTRPRTVLRGCGQRQEMGRKAEADLA